MWYFVDRIIGGAYIMWLYVTGGLNDPKPPYQQDPN